MSTNVKEAENSFENEENEFSSKYQPPKDVPISEIMQKDQDDQSLNEYKKKLLGGAINVIIEPTDPSRLILKRLILVPDDHDEISFDLNESNLDKIKDQVIVLKEGSNYRIKLEFYVQRDIISGLRFVQSSYKGPIRTDKSVYMLGSRAPKGELQEYLSEKEITPSGMIARGKYNMKSSILDDDKNVYAKWDWTLEIAKDWK